MTGGLPDAELARILDAVETIHSCLEYVVETRSNVDYIAFQDLERYRRFVIAIGEYLDSIDALDDDE